MRPPKEICPAADEGIWQPLLRDVRGLLSRRLRTIELAELNLFCERTEWRKTMTRSSEWY